MVRIISYKERQKDDGETFLVLELQGGIEMVQSKKTGKFYATAKRAFIPSTFDKNTCVALIGTEMQGSIIKEECEPFDYVVKETGEEITLYHRWVYSPEENQIPGKIEPTSSNMAQLEPDLKQFSQNGILEYAGE